MIIFVILLGAAIGTLYFFWPRNESDVDNEIRPEAESQTIAQSIETAQEQVEATPSEPQVVPTANIEATPITPIETTHEQAETTQAEPQTTTEMNVEEGLASSPDDLTKIRGIGAKFASRFQEAGITTFTELACLTPEQIIEIVKPRSANMVNPEAWVAQANVLAEGN